MTDLNEPLAIDSLTIKPTFANHYALSVAGNTGKPVLTIAQDGTLWIDPERTSEAAEQMAEFYRKIVVPLPASPVPSVSAERFAHIQQRAESAEQDAWALRDALMQIVKRDDWTSGECRHHAAAALSSQREDGR